MRAALLFSSLATTMREEMPSFAINSARAHSICRARRRRCFLPGKWKFLCEFRAHSMREREPAVMAPRDSPSRAASAAPHLSSGRVHCWCSICPFFRQQQRERLFHEQRTNNNNNNKTDARSEENVIFFFTELYGKGESLALYVRTSFCSLAIVFHCCIYYIV